MNSFGSLFRVSIFGESHGKGVGIIVDGCPAGIELSDFDFIQDLARRKSGAKGTTPRLEADEPKLYSGVYDGVTTGAPILIRFENTNTKSPDYAEIRHFYRPGHADFVASEKFGGHQDFRGGGHFSGRLTVALVAAGVVAKKILNPINLEASVVQVGNFETIEEGLDYAIEQKDSIGGLIQCQITNVPVGMGEPFFNSAESMISHMVFSVPAVKGIEFGAGFRSAKMLGSQHNDPFISKDGTTSSNNNGGINGGITNGNSIVFQVAVKPTSSIFKEQTTMNFHSGKVEKFELKGRHDVCIALRAPVVIEAAAAIALADLSLLAQKTPRVYHKKEK